jgi:hypothetical protein
VIHTAYSSIRRVEVFQSMWVSGHTYWGGGGANNAWAICGSTLEMQWLRRDGRIKLQQMWWMQVMLRMPTGLNSLRIGTLPGCANKSAESFLFYCNTWFSHLASIPEAASRSATQEFPLTFYGTRRFITVFTRTGHWSLSWARKIQSIPLHPISLRSTFHVLNRTLGRPRRRWNYNIKIDLRDIGWVNTN